MARRGRIIHEKNGSWTLVADVAPVGAPRKQVRRRGFKTKREAQEQLTKLLGESLRGDFVEPDKITVSAWFARWLESLDLAPATIKSYSDTLRLHVTPDIGSARLQALQTVDVDHVYNRLRAEGRLSIRSIRNVHTVLKGALSAAVKKRLLTVNPADAATPPPESAARPPEMTTWSPAETRNWLEHELVRSDRLHALWRLACMTGLRRGELLGLKWSDLEGDRLSVRRQVVLVNQKPRLTDTKTPNAHRAVALDPETVNVLRAHRRRQLEERLELGVRSDDGLVFAELDGSLILPSRVTWRFSQLVRDTGVPRIRFHDLRHSHATHLLDAGVSSKAVAARLGHSSVNFSLDKYAHATREGDELAARAVAELVDHHDHRLR
jgi:integrase